MAMRARNIRPGLFKNEILGAADPLYTILFQGLWCLADREGRLEDRPVRIACECTPYRSNFDCDAALTWLDENKFIERYVHENSKYIQILNFSKHQYIINSERQSAIPARQTINSNRRKLIKSDPISDVLISDTLISDVAPAPKGFDKIRETYPKRVGGQRWMEAEKAYGSRLKEGHTAELMLASVVRYAAHLESIGKAGTEFVLQAATFFGPGKHFLEEWGTSSKGPKLVDPNKW